MAKDKKQNYSNQNSKTTRNIHKDQFGSKTSNQKDTNRKNSSYNLYHNEVLPPNKSRSTHTVQHNSANLNAANAAGTSTSNITSHKKIQARN